MNLLVEGALGVMAVAAGGYQLVGLAACVRQLLRRDPAPPRDDLLPAVSLLRPVHGLDHGLEDAVRSLATEDYPGELEILFGLSDPADPARPLLERLAAEFPSVPMRILVVATDAPNRKAGVLAGLEREARHPIVIAADADIAVPRGYLRSVVAPLMAYADVGLVTCIYRARASTFQAAFEALGVATDFAPSALVAPLVGIGEFGLGSTLALRRAELRRMGGFAAVAEYLADDYQVGRQVTRKLGLRVWLSRTVVETSLEAASWSEMWRHQVRWARTVRVSRGDGYVGLPVTFAMLWAVLAACAGMWWTAGALVTVRMAMALTAALGVLRCPVTARWWPLIPLRDLMAAAVWIAGLAGHGVEWRGERIRVTRDGRIEKGVAAEERR